MISAGVEGGSKAAIETEWDLHDFEAIRSYWKRSGPPIHIALVEIGRALGVDLLPKQSEQSAPELNAPAGPSIAEIAAQIAQPRAGQDTLAASIAALRLASRN